MPRIGYVQTPEHRAALASSARLRQLRERINESFGDLISRVMEGTLTETDRDYISDLSDGAKLTKLQVINAINKQRAIELETAQALHEREGL